MNYIAEINAFYDWLETNRLSDSGIVLWHALMHINNKTGWKREFAVAISTIENKTALSKSSIIRSRNALQQAGRIKFRSREGQQSAVYSIIAFHGDTQSDTQTVTQSGTQSGTQTVTIPKLNQTKQDALLQGLKNSCAGYSDDELMEEVNKIIEKYGNNISNPASLANKWAEKMLPKPFAVSKKKGVVI